MSDAHKVIHRMFNELTRERDELRKRAERAERAEAACAEMRNVILCLFCDPKGNPCVGSQGDKEIISHALDISACGKDYEHKSKREEAEKACAAQRDWIDAMVANWVFSDPPPLECGKDYVPKAELLQKMQQVEELREAWEELKQASIKFTDEIWAHVPEEQWRNPPVINALKHLQDVRNRIAP